MGVLVRSHSGGSRVAVWGAGVIAVAAGSVLFSPFCHADDIAYGYDALNRLTSVTVAGNAAYYDYDAAGNITAIRRQGPLSAATPSDLPDATVPSQASAR